MRQTFPLHQQCFFVELCKGYGTMGWLFFVEFLLGWRSVGSCQSLLLVGQELSMVLSLEWSVPKWLPREVP